ncbi:MAG: NTP transferase domain-containing protein, partial [Campylobacteraceae bacterium]|nr:NTP transferase domain-containing protein [Campylobacteraceae bacterium]
MIIIPARLGSTRFEKKVLASIHGIPMVIATAKRVQGVDDVVIATDALEVLEVAKKYNIKAVLTNSSHQSGTDRIYEAANILGLNDDEVILNVQADEPFIEPKIIQSLHDFIYKNRYKEWVMASCCKNIDIED